MPRHVRSFAALLIAAALAVGGAPAAFAVGGMQIFVVTPAGTTLTLDVDTSDSIENVRQKIQDQTGILPERQVLTYYGVILVDGATLADYSIPKESMLLLTPSTPLTLSPTTFAPFVVGAPFSGSVLTTGGFGVVGDAVSFAVTAGALPAGVALDPTTGALTGTPTAYGPWSFTITVSVGGVTATQSFSGVIAPRLAATGVDPSALIAAAALLLLVGAALRGPFSGRRASIRLR